jgi:hypothetical protein
MRRPCYAGFRRARLWTGDGKNWMNANSEW